MAITSGVMSYCSGLIHPKLQFQILKYNWSRSNDYNAIRLVPKRIPRVRMQCSPAEGFGTRHATFVGRNHHELSFDDDFPMEPFWLSPIKEAFRALKSLLVFLVEQPSQLKYIEWPSFQSTLKTALLTLVLVALLIVALSSVDSALYYLLTLFMRRTP
ncbi:uncharacterized protein LOC132300708 [Cornus florida]|uniref:uncharacterized protein LOC132300708 n=1 Tax=Cornus florida TaxID=4283 RepID=UPI0028990929|nr:uncharacterized protein LOC132300708 [Cornus florida]